MVRIRRHRPAPWPKPLKRAGLLLQLVLFALTGPGLGELELLAHATGLVDVEHEREPHVEPAGQAAHADHCQLGLTAVDGRLPATPAITLRDRATRSGPFRRPPRLEAASGRSPTSLPRAPPA